MSPPVASKIRCAARFAPPLVAAILLALAPALTAAPVRLQLVRFDRPEEQVPEESRKLVERAAAGYGGRVKLAALGLEFASWCRYVLVDGQPAFERYENDSKSPRYVGRAPSRELNLAPGRHIVWPGNHEFSVNDKGEVTTASPHLIAQGNTLRIKAYPVRIESYWMDLANNRINRSSEPVPLTYTVMAAGSGLASDTLDYKAGSSELDLIQRTAKESSSAFTQLELWLPANNIGHGYMLRPSGPRFHLDQDGVKIGAGGSGELPGYEVERFHITIPLFGFPVEASEGGRFQVSGAELQARRISRGLATTQFCPRPEPYVIHVGNPSNSLTIDGSLTNLAVKSFWVGNDGERAMGAAIETRSRHFTQGAKVSLRFQAAGADTNTPLSAWMRAYPDGEWRNVPLSRHDDAGNVELTVPSGIAAGVAVLRLAHGTDPETALPRCNLWSTVAPQSGLCLGLFTQRGRNVFLRGEHFWIALGVAVNGAELPAGAGVELDLTGPDGKIIPVYRARTETPVAGHETFILNLDKNASLSLAPGRYTAIARVNSQASRPLAFDIVETERRTHFAIHQGKGGSYGGYGLNAEAGEEGRPGFDTAEFVRLMDEAGYNSWMMNMGGNYIIREKSRAEEVGRERFQIGPWEPYYSPTKRERLLNELTRGNIDFYDCPFPYNDSGFAKGKALVATVARVAALTTASQRFSPAMKGCHLYQAWYWTGDGWVSNPDVATYMERHPGMTPSKAMKALDRYASQPADQRDPADLAAARTWGRFLSWEGDNTCRTMASAIKALMPDARNSTVMEPSMDPGNHFGESSGIDVGGTMATIFDSLEIANHMNYKDGTGCGPHLLDDALMNDTKRINDTVDVWAFQHYGGFCPFPGNYMMTMWRLAMLSLSQKVEGFSNGNQDAPREPKRDDGFTGFRNVNKLLLEPYGDLFLKLQKGYKKVAIYYSEEADMLTARKRYGITKICAGIWLACLRAGYPADILWDKQILAGKGMEYDVLFVPGIEFEAEMSEPILQAVRKVANAGKIIAVERHSKIPIPGAMRLDSSLADYDYLESAPFSDNLENWTANKCLLMEPLIPVISSFLSKHIPQSAESDLFAGPDWQRAGEGEYLFVSHMGPSPIRSVGRLDLLTSPRTSRLRFPKRPPHAYDMLEMQPVKVERDGDWMSMTADLRSYPGKIYAFLPSPIEKLRIKVDAKPIAGENCDYSVEVLDPAGRPINAGFPLEITLRDPAGSEALHVYRAGVGEFRGTWRIPAATPAGKWKLEVRELIAGTRAAATFDVASARTLPTAALDRRAVRVFNPEPLRKLVDGKEPLVIVVDPRQEWVRGEAERIVQTLAKRGREARIVSFKDVARVPASADLAESGKLIDGGRMWRGDIIPPPYLVDHPLILLGKGGENILLDSVLEQQVPPEPFTENFPGPGKSMVVYLHNMFSIYHHSAAVMANDTTGLRAGVDALLDLAKAPEPVPPHPSAVLPEPDLAAVLRDATEPLERKRSPVSESIGLVDEVRCLTEDPASGRILVGTHGFGNNLFCLDSKGNLLWKQFLPEQDVYQAQWYDNGKRVLALTGEGPYGFIMDGTDGRVLKRFVSSPWRQPHHYEGPVNTESPAVINAAQRQILVLGLSGLLAMDYDGRRLWYYDRAGKYSDRVSGIPFAGNVSFDHMGRTAHVVPSPDGRYLLFAEYLAVGKSGKGRDLVMRYVPRLLDASTGEPIAEDATDKGGSEFYLESKYMPAYATHAPLDTRIPRDWNIAWPAGSVNPVLQHSSGRLWTLALEKTAEGKVLVRRDERDEPLRFELDYQKTSRIENGKKIWTVTTTPTNWMPVGSIARTDGTRVYRQSRIGTVLCLDGLTGSPLWRHELENESMIVPRTNGLFLASENGLVIRVDDTGKDVWRTDLKKLNDIPEGDYSDYMARMLERDPDISDTLYAAGLEQPGDLDGVVRRGLEQVQNGGFETDAGWTASTGALVFASEAASGKKALALKPGVLVMQEIGQRIIPRATYLLEFRYRPLTPDARLLAGAQGANEKEYFTSSAFKGGALNNWKFGRLAIKTYAATKSFVVGFEALQGSVLLDEVSLRAVRFPSANFLQDDDLHAVEPKFVKDIRISFDRIPSSMRRRLMDKNRVGVGMQGFTTRIPEMKQEEAYLQNGRLDDVGQRWSFSAYTPAFTIALQRPAFVSHIVIYLNNATPENTYRNMLVLAADMKTKDLRTVGHVENNRRRFIVMKFPKPVFSDSFRILPGMHPNHEQCMTEIEVYGPLSGEEDGVSAYRFPDDPDGIPMFMGTPEHVIRNLQPDLVGTFSSVTGTYADGSPLSRAVQGVGATVVSNYVTLNDGRGRVWAWQLGNGSRWDKDGAWLNWSIGTFSPSTTPARYAGRMLVGSSDYKLHAVADNGTHMWAVQTGGRVCSSPAPDGEDVYFGSDDGRLYKVDVDSGMPLWEFKTGGRIRSSPALAGRTVFVASYDGFLYAVDADGGKERWKAPIAPLTRSSPAVRDGRVYIGDEKGSVYAFDARDGKQAWKHKIEGFVSMCPVVTPDGVFFASEQGHGVFVNMDGKTVWSVDLQDRITGQPMPTSTQLVVPRGNGVAVLQRSDGRPDERFKPPEATRGIIAAIPYRGTLALVQARVEYGSLVSRNFSGRTLLWKTDASHPDQASTAEKAAPVSKPDKPVKKSEKP
jgi:outer membrane protein assembly factor BamB